MSLDDIVPTIDIGSPAATDLAAIDRACRDHGFFLLQGHGLDEVIDATWTEARRFFESDRTLRLTVQRDEDTPLGWFDRELTKRRRDHKQVYDFIEPGLEVTDAFNRWPDPTMFVDFRPTMVAFYDAFSELATR
ncbi:MAG: 2-oxoglutarate and iron-dependent oxygenase domain-containing protein, partial [Actinomycetota bacterium]